MSTPVPAWLRRCPPFVSGAAGIVLIVVLTYWPAFNGQFVWDDLLLVHKNPLVTGKLNLATIWFRTDFPLSMVALWLEWLVWGNHPAGYHVVNVVLHALGAILFWRVLARLPFRSAGETVNRSQSERQFRTEAAFRHSDTPTHHLPDSTLSLGPWLAAVLFAVHPVAAASVGWISELKNTLSLPFYLLSIWCFLRYDEKLRPAVAAMPNPKSSASSSQAGGLRARSMYALALLAFVLALLSKTSTVMLPAVLLLCIWWRRTQESEARLGIQPRDVAQVAPFFVLALAFGLLTMWFQQQAIGGVEVQTESFWARLAGAGRAVWFYLGKALVPIQLNFIYPRWSIEPKALTSWIPLAGLVAAFAWSWHFRRSCGRAILFGLGCFVLNLMPVLGFVDMYYLALSRVSDHFAYLALLPSTALVAGGLVWLATGETLTRFSGTERSSLLLGAAVVLLFATLTFNRVRLVTRDETLWRDTLAKNPAAWTARNNLGCILAEQGNYDQAISQFVAGLQVNPRNAEAHCNLGRALAAKGRFEEADTHFREALSIRPQNADVERSYAAALAQQGKAEAALPHFREALRVEPDFNTRLQFASLLYQTHHPAEAANEYRLALKQKPDHVEVLNNLAWLLATSGDASVRNGKEAVELAERACRLSGENNPMQLGTLAVAYAEAGRFKEAIATAQKAVDLADRAGNRQLAAMNQQLLNLYRAGKPFHEPAN